MKRAATSFLNAGQKQNEQASYGIKNSDGIEVMTILKNILLGFLVTAFLKAFRGSILIIGIWLLISNTGGWRFFSSSFLAHDLSRTAYWSKTDRHTPKVVVVAIDDEGYQGFFSAKSPLDRKQMTQLLKTIATSAPTAHRITLDLDVSPVPAQAEGQKVLDDYLLQDPMRWVLPAVNSGADIDVAAQKVWRNQLCSQGISFGLPYVPNEFGYPKLIHQYKGSLADTTLSPPGHCADPTDKFSQKVMPLSPTMLDTGLVVPFNGNLQLLAEILRAVEPDWVVVGGAWGSTDILATPFGDRFGVQVHAAALSGALEHQRIAPYWIQLLASWLFIGFLSVLLSSTSKIFGRWFTPPTDQMTGHRFFLQTVHPLFFTLTTFALLYLLSELLSVLHARTDYWLPSGFIGSVAVGTLLFTWNLGRNVSVKYEDYKTAWQKVVVVPIKQDIESLVTAVKVLCLGPRTEIWGMAKDSAPVSRMRAASEGLFSIGSLLLQVVLPFVLSAYVALKTV